MSTCCTRESKVFLLIMENEIWKPIPNYDGYEVSNYGNVRTIPRQVKHSRNKEYSRSVKSKLLLKSIML